MLILEGRNIKKYYGDRLILDIDNLNIDSNDKIGVVGLNGAGKTTFMDILSSRLVPDEGTVKLYGSFSYITQLENSISEKPEAQVARLFKVPLKCGDFISGGERTRLKIASSLCNNANIIFADEPTSNLDIEGVRLLENKLSAHDGALILISHDRYFLDKLCNKILELENGKIKIYNGNYSSYKEQKKAERERQGFEYEQYIKERKRLEEAIIDKKQHSAGLKKAPKRMGNSEARLHKMGNQKAKKNLDNAVKALQSRIEKLDVKDRPEDISMTKIDIQRNEKIHSKVLIKGNKIQKSYENKKIFEKANFEIYNGWKVALIGDNGCGKTTLIRMIMEGYSNIEVSKTLKIGYFSQDLSILNEEESILENVMEESIHDETFVRIILSRLLFKKEDIYKKIKVLSGGERVKVSFAKIFVQDINMLILDEPTNYLDIYSSEAIENALKEFEGTVLFVSHDREFINQVADHILKIDNNKIEAFNGNYKEYIEKKEVNMDKEKIKNQKMVIENKISEVISRISMPSKKDNKELLEQEYKSLLEELRLLKDLDL